MDIVILAAATVVLAAYATYIAATATRIPLPLRLVPVAGLVAIGLGFICRVDSVIVAGIIVSLIGFLAHIALERILGGASRGTGRHS